MHPVDAVSDIRGIPVRRRHAGRRILAVRIVWAVIGLTVLTFGAIVILAAHALTTPPSGTPPRLLRIPPLVRLLSCRTVGL